jgi:hypothetical protein
MDLTPGRQRLVFAVVALALVGLGIYLISNRGSGTSPAAPPPASSSTAPSGAAGTSPAGTPPSTVPSAAPVSTAGGAEIYQWLPFTPADLAAASQTTVSFAEAYATWSYTEDKAAYGAKLNGLVTTQEIATLEYDYNTPGVAGPRASDKQVSTGSGAIDSINSFGTGPVSITFVVTINQQVTSTQPATTLNGKYSVTVVSSGSAWQVSGIQLSTLGNQ